MRKLIKGANCSRGYTIQGNTVFMYWEPSSSKTGFHPCDVLIVPFRNLYNSLSGLFKLPLFYVRKWLKGGFLGSLLYFF